MNNQIHYLFGHTNFEFSKLNFQLLSIITPLLLDQLTCSLPKNVTTFHEEKDRIIHFCLSPYEQKFGKRKMADSDFNFFFKNPKYPLGNPPFCLWNHQKWFWGPKIAPLSFSQKFWKNITPHVFAPSTLNFCPIFKCHTILESWRVAGFDGTKILWGKFMTNEKSALEIWLSRGL